MFFKFNILAQELKPNDMLVSFSWQGYLDFSLFTLHFSLQQLSNLHYDK